MEREVIEERIEHINERLKDVKEGLKDFENKEEKKYILAALEKWSEEIVESAIAINQDLLDLKYDVGLSYYDSFTELHKLNILDESFLERIASTAGFRNRLAHNYLELDKEVVVKSMKKILKMYPTYISAINEFLKR